MRPRITSPKRLLLAKVYGFQASAAMLMRSPLFWDITRRLVVIVYRRFGNTVSVQFSGYTNPLCWGRYVDPKRRKKFTPRRGVISQKSADLKVYRWLSLLTCVCGQNCWTAEGSVRVRAKCGSVRSTERLSPCQNNYLGRSMTFSEICKVVPLHVY
jgi:hypothetical protein